MKFRAADVPALVAYGAGGGFAGVFAFAGFMFPKEQQVLNGAAIATVALCGSLAGILKLASSPAPSAGMVSSEIPVGTAPVVTAATGPGKQIATTGATTTVRTVVP